ncbi:PREDICTED: uncharacterized protein LOC105313251 [Amphimedon queenslandica]|uniref:Uncharacterized protein n=1 Tax=Amphimedon queenslandica TaxID=400682 RepID=A0A1X7UKQ8_AMPQE|nr:PREDICTED: uncharacterized protein LOC105313251 [Amphimedon queenslandica]|eukprot:XP_011404833.1 PREDICTED: uncharacterized protein LOC105313251 [Amphimedon queenslandica]
MATNPEEYISFDNVSPPYPQPGLYPTPHHHTTFPPPSRGPPFPPPVGPGSYYKGPYHPNPLHHHHHYHHRHPYEQQYQQHHWTNPYNRGRGGRRGRGNYRGKRKRPYHEPIESSEGDDQWFEWVLADPWKDLITEDEELTHRQRLSKGLVDIPHGDSNTSTITSPSLRMVADPVRNTTEPHCIKVAAQPGQSVAVQSATSLSPERGSDNIYPKQEDLSKDPLIVTPSSSDSQIPSQPEGPLTSGSDDIK